MSSCATYLTTRRNSNGARVRVPSRCLHYARAGSLVSPPLPQRKETRCRVITHHEWSYGDDDRSSGDVLGLLQVMMPHIAAFEEVNDVFGDVGGVVGDALQMKDHQHQLHEDGKVAGLFLGGVNQCLLVLVT